MRVRSHFAAGNLLHGAVDGVEEGGGFVGARHVVDVAGAAGGAQRTQDGVGFSAWRPWLTRGRDGLVAVRRGVEVNAKVTVGLRRIMTPAPPLVGCRWAHKPIVRASTPYFVCACGVQTYNPARLQDCCRLFASQTLPSASELRSGLTLFAGCAHALQEYLHSKL